MQKIRVSLDAANASLMVWEDKSVILIGFEQTQKLPTLLFFLISHKELIIKIAYIINF